MNQIEFYFQKISYFAYFLSACLALVICRSASAQNAIQSLNTSKGLSNDRVYSIAKDERGFMWFGTEGGLNRYDGGRFDVFHHEPRNPGSLVEGKVLSLYSGKENILWIATTHGACKYQYIAKKMTRMEYDTGSGPTDPQNIPVINFTATREGDVFLTVMERGIYVCRNGKKAAKHIPIRNKSGIVSSYFVYSSAVDTQDRIWFFADKIGLCRIDPGSDVAVLVSSSYYYTWFMKGGPDGNIWFGGEFGLYVYETHTNRFQKKTDAKFVRNVVFTKDSTAWFVAGNDGVYSGKINDNRFIRHDEFGQFPEFTKAILSIFIDDEGSIWLGTENDGVVVIKRSTNGALHFVSHFLFGGDVRQSKYITALEEDKSGNIWIGTYGGGIKRWNRTQNTFDGWTSKSPGTPILSDVIQDILCDRKGQIWIATFGGGISCYRPSTRTFQHFSCYNSERHKIDNLCLSLYEDSSGDIWAGMQDGRLAILKRDAKSFVISDISIVNVASIFEDRDNSFWFGTDHYLIHANKTTRKRESYRIGAESNAIFRDSLDQFWVGTANGLFLFDKKQRSFIRYTKADGLCDNNIVGLTNGPDRGIWISTMNGISRLDPVTKKFSTLSGYDGTPFPKFSRNATLRLRSEELLFGGNEGFYLFNPIKATKKQRSLPLRLTGLNVGGEPIETSPEWITSRGPDGIREITVPYDKADLEIDFVALEFLVPKQVRYSYLLEGFDKNWSTYSDVRSARYSNLPDGVYFFQIRAGLDTSVWNKQEQLVKIIVLPPWYRTWWAYIIYTFLFLSALGAVISYFIIRERWKFEVELTRSNAENDRTQILLESNLREVRKEAENDRLRHELSLANLKTEREKETYSKRIDFFTGIAHEFRTPITLIINPLKEFLFEGNRDLGLIATVYSNATRLFSMVNNLMEFRKAEDLEETLCLEETDLVSLSETAFQSFQHLAQLRSISFEFRSSIHPGYFLSLDKTKIQVVLLNLLSNSFKNTPDGGSIQLHISGNSKWLIVNVSDNGAGIPAGMGDQLFEKYYQGKDQQGKGFGLGLYLVRKFVDLHGGELTYTSEPNVRTTFSVKLGLDRSIPGQPDIATRYLISPDQPELVASQEVAQLSETARSFHEPPILMIIEDESDVRSYLGRIFEAFFTVIDVAGIQQALGLMVDIKPDIILTDTYPKGELGTLFWQQTGHTPHTAHIPLALITGKSDLELSAEQIYADLYIRKPFDRDILFQQLTSMLRKKDILHSYFYQGEESKVGQHLLNDEARSFLISCISIIENHAHDPEFKIHDLVREAGMSHSALYKKLKSSSGYTINGLIRFVRLRRASRLLLTGMTVGESADRCGFNDSKYFREQFLELFGLTPAEYRAKYSRYWN